ncbi:hypothetical protein [Serratia marcescens]|uniref:hypothetical protein n=1 Tax=Serratia marcescens TaxID=615 RepID=UPI001F15250C|nr:hypothetical protein [Serratia marcescens]
MAMKDLPLWLLKNEGFINRLKMLTIDSVISQFDAVVSTYQGSMDEVNVSYMLTCASLLAHSDKSQCQEAALRIAQYCLQSNEPKNRKDGAALVLDALANDATIRLAEKRDMIDGGYESRLPLSAQLESTKRRILHTINLADETKIG